MSPNRRKRKTSAKSASEEFSPAAYCNFPALIECKGKFVSGTRYTWSCHVSKMRQNSLLSLCDSLIFRERPMGADGLKCPPSDSMIPPEPKREIEVDNHVLIYIESKEKYFLEMKEMIQNFYGNKTEKSLQVEKEKAEKSLEEEISSSSTDIAQYKREREEYFLKRYELWQECYDRHQRRQAQALKIFHSFIAAPVLRLVEQELREKKFAAAFAKLDDHFSNQFVSWKDRVSVQVRLSTMSYDARKCNMSNHTYCMRKLFDLHDCLAPEAPMHECDKVGYLLRSVERTVGSKINWLHVVDSFDLNKWTVPGALTFDSASTHLMHEEWGQWSSTVWFNTTS